MFLELGVLILEMMLLAWQPWVPAPRAPRRVEVAALASMVALTSAQSRKCLEVQDTGSGGSREMPSAGRGEPQEARRLELCQCWGHQAGREVSEACVSPHPATQAVQQNLGWRKPREQSE